MNRMVQSGTYFHTPLADWVTHSHQESRLLSEEGAYFLNHISAVKCITKNRYGTNHLMECILLYQEWNVFPLN